MHPQDYVVFFTVSFTGWPEKVSHYQMIKNRIKSYLSLSTELGLFIKLKYESSTIYSCARSFLVEIDEKFSLSGGF